MLEDLLRDIGLSEGESKVYLTLLKTGPTKTGYLSKEAGVSSSKVYKILDRLEKKGLVGHIVDGKVKKFNAMPSKAILDYMDETAEVIAENRRLLVKELPEIENLRKQQIDSTEAYLYMGFKAVTNSIRNIIEELGAGEQYHVMGANYGSNPDARAFFWNFHKIRSDKGVRVKMLANHDTRGNLEETTLIKSDIRFMPKHLMTAIHIFFYKDKTLLIIWASEPTALLIKSKENVTGFKKYFDAFWKISKK